MTSSIDQDLSEFNRGSIYCNIDITRTSGSSTNSDAVGCTSSTTTFFDRCRCTSTMVRAQVRVRWCSSNSVVHITITRWYQRRIYNFIDQCRSIGVGVRIRSSRITIIVTTITATSTSRSTKKKKWWMEFVPLQNWTRSHLTVLHAWPLLAAWRMHSQWNAFPAVPAIQGSTLRTSC